MVQATKDQYRILDDDTYNFDETGFMLGVIGSELVVTGTERRNQPKSIQPGNCEWITAIITINMLGWWIPPFLLFSWQYHLQAWYKGNDLIDGSTIALSDNGWTTDGLRFEWLKHFDKQTRSKTRGHSVCSF